MTTDVRRRFISAASRRFS